MFNFLEETIDFYHSTKRCFDRGVVNWAIDGVPQKKNFPSFYLKYLGWFMIMDKFTKYSKLRS